MYRVYQVIEGEEHQRNTAFFKNTTLVIIMSIIPFIFEPIQCCIQFETKQQNIRVKPYVK